MRGIVRLTEAAASCPDDQPIEAVPLQVHGAAGEMQIEGAARMAPLNIGGSTATTASFVVERGNGD